MPRAGDRAEAVPLHATERNPQRETKGRRVANVSAKIMGRPFIPWQHDLADLAHEIDPATGMPWYSEILVVVERQCGKTTYGRAELTDTCLYKPNAIVRYTAQNRLMANQRLEADFWRPISQSPLAITLDTRVGRRTGKLGLSGKNGQEHIAFANGSTWWIDSVKATSGHGPTLHKGLIDEAFAHPDGRVEGSMTPATQNVPDSQLYVMSAAGDINSGYLRAKLEAARARVLLDQTKPMHERRSRTALIEYAVGPGEDPDDPETWWHRHPGLGHVTTQAKIEAARESFAHDPDEFYRAYCGIWPTAKVPDPVIPRVAWNDQARTEEQIDWTGEPVWSIDVAPDRDWSAIALAARHPGVRAWLEVVAYEQGTHWTVRHLVALRQQFGGNVVAIDGSGAAGALAADLEAEGFDVRRLTIRDKVDACGGLYDDVLSGLVLHGADPVLDGALFSAVKRSTDNAWTFWRGKSLRDISPLYAVTLARHVLVQLIGQDYDVLESVY